MKKVAICIPFLGNSTWIKDCLIDFDQNTNYPFDYFLVGSKVEEFTIPALNRVCTTKFFKEQKSVAQAWNILLEMAGKYDYTLLLNDDTLSAPKIENCWLTQLITNLEKEPTVGVGSPIWVWAGADADSPKRFKDMAWGYHQQHKGEVSRGIQGFCFAIKKKVLDDLKIQGFDYVFDESFPCMWEECEWLWRVHQLGWESRVYGDIPIFHYGSKTIGTLDQIEVKKMYDNGMNTFFTKTGAKMGPMWGVYNGLFCTRNTSNEPWKPWGIQGTL